MFGFVTAPPWQWDFDSGNLALISGSVFGIVSAAHGLGSVPRAVRAVLVCTTADGAFSAGDEVDATCWYNYGGGNHNACVVSCDATNVYARLTRVRSDADGTILDGTAGTVSTLTAGSWALKLQAKR